MDGYPPLTPHRSGMLDVGDGNRIYWQVSGNPDGKPAIVLHGGPGSGSSPSVGRYFNPALYRIVQFDQRCCGLSTPDAADPATDLSTNTTAHHITDIELLRQHLDIDSWLVFGGSWGSILGLCYAQEHPEHVDQIVMVSVVTGTAREIEWITRDMGRIFPAEWERFIALVPEDERDGNLAAAYARLLAAPDPALRERAAQAWCDWEDTHVSTHPGHSPDPRYRDPVFRMRFARLVTHNWANHSFLPDNAILDRIDRLAAIPAVLVNGKLDVSGPPDAAWRLAQRWPGAELMLIDEAGHGTGHTTSRKALTDALDRFAAAPSPRMPPAEKSSENSPCSQ